MEDFNDHCPTLTSTLETLCIPEEVAIISAVDKDDFPNGAPFTFEIIPENTEGKWQVEHLNGEENGLFWISVDFNLQALMAEFVWVDTATILRARRSLWPGLHKVKLLVKDQQGQACSEMQEMMVQVCTCEDGFICGRRGGSGQPDKKSEFGPAGIGLLLLGLLLLLCKCD